MMKKSIVISALLFTAACSGGEIKDTLGLNRSTPDEFRVVSRPPLSVPPDFALRPPMPGLSEENTNMQTRAQNVLLGRGGAEGTADTAVPSVSSSSLPEGADAQFLGRAGAQNADPQVRAKLTEEALQEQELREEKEDSLLGDILPGGGSKEPVVDAGKERERIEQNKKENKPISGEGAKELDPKKRGILEGIVN